jgi:hypothetical protein
MDSHEEDEGIDEENYDEENLNVEYEYPILSTCWTDNDYYVRNLIHSYLKMPKNPALRFQMQKVENFLLYRALPQSSHGREKIINRLAGWISDGNPDGEEKYRRAETKVNENVYLDADPTMELDPMDVNPMYTDPMNRRFHDIGSYLGMECNYNDRKHHWLTEQGLTHLIQIMGGVYGGRDGLHSKAVLDFLAFFEDTMLMMDPSFNVTLIPSTITNSMYLMNGKGVRCCVPDAIGVFYDLVPGIIDALSGDAFGYHYHPDNTETIPAFGNSTFLQFEIQLTNYDRLVDKFQKNLSLNAEETTKSHIYPVFVIKEEKDLNFPAFESVLETLTSVLPDSLRKDRLNFFNLISFSAYYRPDIMTLDWPQLPYKLNTPSSFLPFLSGNPLSSPKRIFRYGEH